MEEITGASDGRARRDSKAGIQYVETACKSCGEYISKPGREAMKYHRRYQCPENPLAERNRLRSNEKKRHNRNERRTTILTDDSEHGGSMIESSSTDIIVGISDSVWVRLDGLLECEGSDISGLIIQMLERTIPGSLLDKVEFLLKGGEEHWGTVKRCLNLLGEGTGETDGLNKAIYDLFKKQFLEADDSEVSRWRKGLQLFKVLDNQCSNAF